MPTALIDFDGVIHRYSRGWANGTAYDEPVPGAREALEHLAVDGYEVVIFSTRDWEQIADWLEKHGFPPYPITDVKRPATFIIDDRAIRFADWSQALADVHEHYPLRRV